MKGRAEFKMSVQREAQLIKDCLTFSGPPDTLRGEEIYRRYNPTVMQHAPLRERHDVWNTCATFCLFVGQTVSSCCCLDST